MGANSFAFTKQIDCRSISREDYSTIKRKGWGQQQYLYQTELQGVRSEKLTVVSYQLNLQQPPTQRYFERLKMMGKYLTGGNILLPLICVNSQSDQCACSTFEQTQTTIVNFYYDSFEIKLHEELMARQKCREHFAEAQIWYMAYSLLNALRQFEPFCEPAGDISLQKVVMNHKGEIRLRTSLTAPFDSSYDEPKSYHSPEELAIMHRVYGRVGPLNRQIYRQFGANPNVCQTYSLALLLLVLTTFHHPSIFYDGESSLINEKAIAYALNLTSSKGYSRLLVNLIRVMLSLYPNRPLPSQVYQTFRPYEHQIRNFLPFTMQNSMQQSLQQSTC